MIRTFIAIELPESLKQSLARVQRRLECAERINWVKAANMHLTLRFLGDVPEKRIDELKACMERTVANYSPFELTPKGLGAFPNLRRPRVFWAGIEDASRSLTGLQKRLQTELEQAGFGREDYPFSPHITLGRVKDPSIRATQESLKQLEFSEKAFRVQEIVLMRSDLRPEGSLYTRLVTTRLRD